MTPSASIRIAGFNALLAASGEGLTYRVNNTTQSVKAIVNRKLITPRDRLSGREGKLNFDVTGMTTVEFLRSAMQEPEVGSSFVDSIGFSHRVRKLENTDITWFCYCTQSKQS